MSGQYIVYKSDAKSPKPTQTLTAGRWARLEAEGHTVLLPTVDSAYGALWAFYAYLDIPRIGGATQVTTKWVRNPGTKEADETGRMTWQLTKGQSNWINQVWLFHARKGQPVGLEIVANGKCTIRTRELKLSVQVAR
jgi:hypothetical protein